MPGVGSGTLTEGRGPSEATEDPDQDRSEPVPEPISEPVSEHRAVRRTLTIVYIAVLGTASLYLLASVVHELFLRKQAVAAGPPVANAVELLRCHDAVSELLEDLGKTAAGLELEAVTGDGRELAQRWAEHERDWRRRWTATNELCRFDRTADPALGPAFEWISGVWERLPAVQLQYRDMMRRFADHPGSDLEEMRAALDRSRRLLQEELEDELEERTDQPSPQPRGSTPQ